MKDCEETARFRREATERMHARQASRAPYEVVGIERDGFLTYATSVATLAKAEEMARSWLATSAATDRVAIRLAGVMVTVVRRD